MSKTTAKRLYHLEKYIQNKWGEYYWNFLMKHEDKLNWSGYIIQSKFDYGIY
jgi:hypothetical protein